MMLPPGWHAVPLAAVTTKVGSGATPRGGETAYKAIGIPLVRSMNVHFDGIRYDGLAFLDDEQARALDGVTVAADDVLLNITGASIGRVTTAPPELAGARVNQHVSIIRLVDGVVPSFVARWLASPAMQRLIAEEESGATRQALTKEKISCLRLPVAPLKEQRRIVAMLDAIFEQTHAAKVRLERLPLLLEKLKRSILAAAFRGDLTADWRATHPDVEPASVLLDRIRAERRRRWEVDLCAKGKNPTKATYEESPPIDSSDLPTLPDSWSWTRADMVVAPDTIITYGIVLPGKHVEGGVPYVRQQDIQNGAIDVDSLLRTHPEIAAKHDRSSLQAKDVLLCIIRHRRVAIVPPELEGANITQGTVRFRPCAELDSHYLAAWLESPMAQQWMEARVFGLDMPRINVSDTREIPIPLPPSEEQTRIVEVITAARVRLTSMAGALAKAATLAIGVERAALAKAFRGELVPQDPTDEPASVLLDRIRAARAGSPQNPSRGREPRQADAPTSGRRSNGHRTTASSDDSLDLVVAALQQGKPRVTAADIADATNLDVPAIKQVLKTLVAAGQVRVHGKARGTSYEWIA